MKLYYLPGACSLSIRIALNELNLPFEGIKVDVRTGKTEAGADYRAINPKGYVPALELDDGTVITENPAILQYLADQHPAAGLAPAPGSIERVRLQEALNFISAELHKAFSPYFGPALEGEEKAKVEAKVNRRISDVERVLADDRPFLLGERFSVADAYLFVVLNWSNVVGVNLDDWPKVAAFLSRVAERPAVHQSLVQEGLIAEDAQG